MPSFWKSLKDTAESLGGAAVAPAGAVLDLAQMPFDETDDDFGTVVSRLSKRAGDVMDPIFNPQTLTGQSLGGILAAMNWAWQEGVSEPVSTGNAMVQHVTGVPTWAIAATAGPPGLAYGAIFGDHHYGDLFDAQAWSKAYQQANQQSGAAGASLAWQTLAPTTDPLSRQNPYADLQREHGALASGIATSGELLASFAADPTALGLKGLGALRQTNHALPFLQSYARLDEGRRASLLTDITNSSRSGVLRGNLTSRTDKYLDWIGGKNSLGRPLSGPEILYGTPELKRYAAEPHVIAGLLADANTFSSSVARRDAQRRILAVAAGDVTQIDRLRTEVGESAAIADALTNMAKDSVIDLRRLAIAPTLRTDPAFVERLDQQLTNLNNRGDVDRFLDDWNARLDQLLATHHTMPNLPGVHAEGKRAINRLNDKGVLRSGHTAAKKVDEWAAQRALEAQSASTVFQKGLYSVPVVAVKTVGLAASPWTKAPVALSDALRQTHFTGIVNLHDWGGATTQLDSMMRLAKVSPGDRMKLLSEAYLAKNEPEKMRIIERIEGRSMQTLAEHYSQKAGHEIDPDYISRLMAEYTAKRGNSATQIRGQAYAATGRPDAAVDSNGARQWRVDQINDDGTPLAMPLLESQLVNSLPLLDVSMARKLLERDSGHLARLSRAWKDEARELDKLAGLKGSGAAGLDRAIAARSAAIDWLVNAGQLFMRGWKFSVLFRLGYPIRVVSDDHMRIWSQMNAGTFYGENLGEFFSNMKFNHFDRKVAAARDLHGLKVRRQEILDELSGEQMSAHADRWANLKSVEASLRSRERAVAKLRQRVEQARTKKSLGLDVPELAGLETNLVDAERHVVEAEGARSYLLEQLGDYGPDDLKRELAAIEEAIAGGSKSQRAPKRTVGTADVVLDEVLGDVIPGAYAGPFGSVMHAAASSRGSFDNQLTGVEDRMFRAASRGAHRTIQPDEPGHLTAWADVLNNQFRTSPVAMHFVNGGSVEDFVRWVKRPEQADLRRRLPHFAHDPEDWGHRVQALVFDYIPTDALRQELLSGRVKSQRLAKLFANPTDRPAVHGRVAADNLGTSSAVQMVGNGVNRIYRFIGELPTDRLSRHPFFNSLYRRHAREVYATKRAGLGRDYRFTQDDLLEIAHTARKLALKDLKRTLFDVSAHSHAAHVMRFVSPFFAAHQEGIARWWRIAADNPQVIRRFTQAFDLPRYLAIEVDENGDLVKPGAPLSRDHRILLQLPQAFGGDDPSIKQSQWSVSEQSFNLVLQGGLTNPGTGPVVTVPLEWAAQRYADDPHVAQVARVFNPFPPGSPMEPAVAATLKRISAWTYAETGVDPSLWLGIGKREYNAAFSQAVQDEMVDFQLKYGREPNAKEAAEIVDRAGTEATTQMFHRVLWNGLSPAPASPQSKYAAIQHGWHKIQQQAIAENRGFDWAYAQFKAKYGEAYMPLVYSTSNNPADVDPNAGTVAALKRYEGVLKSVDPSLTRMVIGAYADDLIAEDATLGDYSPEARNYLRSKQIRTGDSETYYSYDEPRAAAEEQMARRGWQKYGELTGALTAQAQAMGLSSYMESPELLAVKRAGVEQIRAENYAFDKDYGTFDTTQYDRLLDGMREIVASPVLANDSERTDIATLQLYLKLRDFFTQVFDARQQAGLGGYEAQAQDQVRAVYTALVGKLVESNTYFESHMFNGGIDRDPWLLEASPAGATSG